MPNTCAEILPPYESAFLHSTDDNIKKSSSSGNEDAVAAVVAAAGIPHADSSPTNNNNTNTTTDNSTSSDFDKDEEMFETKVEICKYRKMSLKPESVNLFQNAKFYSNVRKRRIEPKPKAFIMFADLDGTFTPMDLEGKQDFVKIIKEIQEQTGCHVKFVPVSGRPSGYVLRVLHECRDVLLGVGVLNVCDYGAAEQGAVIVDSSRSYDQRYLGWFEHKTLKAKVDKILRKNKHWPIISDEPDKLYTCSIHIKNEAKARMSREEQQEVYLSCKRDICAVFGDDVLNIAMSHNCMEVMHKEISKSYAMNILLTKYQRHFNIVGLCMCGDAENDKIALNYVSRLAEVPGVQAHVFTPANAQKAVSTSVLEFWKNKNPHSTLNRIRKGPKNLFLGVTWLIRDELANGTLIGQGLTQWEHAYDDLEFTMRRRRAAVKPLAVSPVKFF